MRHKYTKEILEPVIKESKSWAEVCRKLSIKEATGAQSYVKSRALKFDIDFSHFTGRGWNKGGTSINKRDVHEFLTESSSVKSDYLKKRLIREGIKEYVCEDCGLSEWRGNPIPLELHHINGKHKDNLIDNLRIICPNCHALYNNKNPLVAELA